MRGCLICLRPVPASADYHPRCLRELFGTSRAPDLDVDLARLHTLALAMVGRTSLSGIQRKLSLGPGGARHTLQVAVEGARYILKPQAQTFPHLPENEHLTMRMAREVGIEIPPCGLVRLRDSSLAYIVRRFDRVEAEKPGTGGAGEEDGTRRVRKLACEDFCQLSERSPKDKYRGSAEQCARLVLGYATEPLVEALKLFRLQVFVWWTGNGDMHLKNFSLLRDRSGIYRLSPAYDLLCTRLVIPDDALALQVAGTTRPRSLRPFLELAEKSELPERSARRVFAQLVAASPRCLGLIDRSALPEEAKATYRRLVEERAELLRQVPGSGA